MAKIKIISTPPGQAPLEIREQWVGITIPIVDNISAIYQMGVLGGKPEDLGGYTVETNVAMQELEKKSPQAADWWRKNVILAFMPWLSFSRCVCELIP